jgi:hypothetical protein
MVTPSCSRLYTISYMYSPTVYSEEKEEDSVEHRRQGDTGRRALQASYLLGVGNPNTFLLRLGSESG